ncbi:LysR substrate-binding domain-containing protein [Idiomarina piscisalsi]|uniref:LysR substrate-binding domain-containing protein n=1 Tax=Idiomarina piscisalsi TaxID=1096243 RepID=UPI0013827576|nr:LysR substrate-binding domain-containing protein [Idiomarina piscisalsi]MTJ02872.1 LysR family transcriptional regulator [Idiomarina piscisalsi]
MVDFNDYFYFVHVVEKEGFSAAAAHLEMPVSRLSRHIKGLEERLDVQLIQRSSRQFKVTDTGGKFYRYARAVVDEVEAAETAIQREKNTLKGVVRMSCSVGVAQYALQGLLIEFLTENPQVELLQQVTNQTVDLVANGIDIAIRGHFGALPDSSYIQRHLASVSWRLYASPAYLREFGTPNSPNDLNKHRSLKVGWQSTAGEWQLHSPDGEVVPVQHSPVFCSDDMQTLQSAAKNGAGIVSLPSYVCREEVAANKLVPVLPNWTTGTASLSLLTPSRRSQSLPVKVLSEFILRNLNSLIGD